MTSIELTGYDGAKYTGYLSGTDPSANFALICIQEAWGLNKDIKKHADELSASLNCYVLTPDLYRGKVTDEGDEARHLMSNLDFESAVKDVGKAIEFLKSEYEDVKRIGVIGFCMGGALALLSAASASTIGVDATVCFYGVPGDWQEKLKTVSCPVLMQFGKEDTYTGLSDVATANAAHDIMKQNGVDVTLIIYDGVGHAFMNDAGSPSTEGMRKKEGSGFLRFNKEVRDRAFEKTCDFFKKCL